MALPGLRGPRGLLWCLRLAHAWVPSGYHSPTETSRKSNPRRTLGLRASTGVLFRIEPGGWAEGFRRHVHRELPIPEVSQHLLSSARCIRC